MVGTIALWRNIYIIVGGINVKIILRSGKTTEKRDKFG
jgi:hypothetical protein